MHCFLWLIFSSFFFAFYPPFAIIAFLLPFISLYTWNSLVIDSLLLSILYFYFHTWVYLGGENVMDTVVNAHAYVCIYMARSLEPGPSRARYFPRDMLLLTTTARERAWRLLKISSSLIGWFLGFPPILGVSPWRAPLRRRTLYIVEV